MIEVMQRLANKVYPVRYAFMVLAVFSLLAFIYVVLSGDYTLDVYLLPSLTSFGWSLCLFGIADTFNKVPEKVIEGDGFFLRIKKRVKRFVSWFWSLCFLVCTILLFYLSYRALSLALVAS